MTETAPAAIEADVRLPQRRWRPQPFWPVLLASVLLHLVLAGVLYPGGGAPPEAPAPLFTVDVVLRAPGAPALPKGVNAGAPAPPETADAGPPAVAANASSAPRTVTQPSPTSAAPVATPFAPTARVAIAATPRASTASRAAITAAAPSPLTAAKAPTIAAAPVPISATPAVPTASAAPAPVATEVAAAAPSAVAAPSGVLAAVTQTTAPQATAAPSSAVAVAAPEAATAMASNAVQTAQRPPDFVAKAPTASAERIAPSVGPPPSVQAGTAPVLAPDPIRTLQAARPALPPPPLPPRKPPSLLAQERNPRIVRENARIVGAPLPLIDDIPPSGALAGPGGREAAAAAQSGGRVAGARGRRTAQRAATTSTGSEGRAGTGSQRTASVTTPADYRGASFWNPPPPYPFQARRRGLEGQVVVRVQVSPAGWAKSVAVRRSSGHRVLDRAALEAVRDWRFKPAARAGKPTDGEVDVPVVFRLNQ